MASGDAQRVWFPEMIEDLTRYWSPTKTWEDLIAFCRQMTDKRKRIRDDRGISPPIMHCPECGERTRSDIAGISIRSALFVLKKHHIVSSEQFTALDRGWKRFQRAHNLDAYGNTRDS